ncbi:uroporphyrinogen-III synthase [Dactylosporangium sp. NPDC000555]|uniref:uroporphyrinogen-III synthase n=1 Tax=Dactylosporangium sp. NPDC000555 TaxID=3154260 RepID=UPI0033264611
MSAGSTLEARPASGEDLPLAGFTVAVTADRRRDELGALLERRGARVVLAPALRIVPVADDTELKAATVSCVEMAPDIVIATTGIGLRGWIEAAEGWGLGEALRARLGQAYLIARGPKAKGAVRAAGMIESWSPDAEGCDEVLDHLLSAALPGGIAGRRIAVQMHGEPHPEFTSSLRDAGAIVVEIPVYRWAPPVDPAPLRRLVDLICSRLVDSVTFTSAPAVGSLLRVAASEAPDVLEALRTDVLAACVGPVTAAPLQRLGVPVTAPARARLGALVRILVDELPKRSPTLHVAGAAVTLRGHAAIIDGTLKPLAPGPMAVLRALAASPGRVLSRAALLRELPRGADEHAVEMAVARLRAALGGPTFVQTVVKRGYRLRVD